MTTSSMFLADTTNIDHAYIDEQGMIVGGSYRPKFVVTGTVDPVENVVVDFSTIKKTLKATIDDQDAGFDHKLWWIVGKSKGVLEVNGDRISITTDHVQIQAPANAIRIIESSVETELTNYLLAKTAQVYPDVNICIATDLTVDLDVMPQINSTPHLFRYVHGLKESTSWGCQNIGHGHLSYIAATTTNPLMTNMLLAQIAQELDNTVFAWNQNVSDRTIDYTCGRGHMSMKLSADVKLVVLNTETTVEHLVDYVDATYKQELIDAGVVSLFVSEGLSKGACLNVLQ